jgi:predicted ATPase/signal transduction histidine kinase
MDKSNRNNNSLSLGQLVNYRITEEVYSGSRTLVYRAIRIHDQLPVVIKFLKNDYPTFSELVQFRNQYIIAKNLNSSHIISTYSLETYNNSYALIMEDFGGVSLQQWRKDSLSLGEFLRIAIDLSHTLDILYRERIIHKDIKPANILINPETKQIKLIDFSIASLLPRETQEIQNANSLEGTLAYISPEQTGRMNRGIDYRSDFYSLGVTFYELLAGQLPFQSKDPMELVHCHLAKTPKPVHEVNPTIPLVLSNIVAKLMAKNAENRYQSALGIKHDLELCLAQLQETGQIADFEIGTRDISDRFTVPEKLYGRETEVETLLQAFERVSSGSTEMMLVAGFSGIGKTAVVNEVHKPIVRQQGYFIKGKYDQFQRNIPFSAFVQAFRDLMGQLLSESDTQMEVWRTKILSALGDNGQVIIEVVPELALIIGPQPAVTELSGTAAQNRFNLLMQKFVQVFTRVEHPLVIFLDDLQWADSASLKLLELLIADTGYLLILGAYRDNEVSPVHPFILTVDEILKTGAIVNTITLQPLSLTDISQLVADTLNCDRPIAQPLTELVYQKTKGNPFFATQFLKALHEEKQITFNSDSRYWQCDISQIRALALTDNVVEFMALQLQKLPSSTQNVLKLAACIGAQFDLQTLAIISEQSVEVAATALWRALQDGLVIPNTDSYKFFIHTDGQQRSDVVANPTYRFLHDRIQQAAYSLISDNQKKSVHLLIGQLLLSKIPEETRDVNIFAIINNLNVGIDLIIDPDQRITLAQLNLQAAKKAKASTAYISAENYVKISLQLLNLDIWQSDYLFALELYQFAAQSAYFNGSYEEMEKRIEQALKHTDGVLDKLEFYDIQIQSLTSQRRFIEAITLVLFSLELLGIYFPKDPSQQEVGTAIEQITAKCAQQSIEALIDLPIMEQPIYLATMRVLISGISPTYLAAPSLLPLIVFKLVELSINNGNAETSAFAYSMYGLILCGILQDIATGYQFGKLALNLSEKFKAPQIKARTMFIVAGHITVWGTHIKESLIILEDAYQLAIDNGDLEYVGYITVDYCAYIYTLGSHLLEVEDTLKKRIKILSQINQTNLINNLKIYLQVVTNLLELTNTSGKLTGEYFNTNKKLSDLVEVGDRQGLFLTHTSELILSYLFTDFDHAVTSAIIAENYLDGVTGMALIPVFYFYDSLARLQQCFDQGQTVTQHEFVHEKIAENQKKMRHWNNHAPMNFQHKYNLVEAEKYRVLGQEYEAMELYDRAISGAKENGYIQEEALANELAAKFYLNWNKEKIAASYMQDAYYCYSRWGAKAKIQDLERRYPQLLSPILHQQQMALSATETAFTTTSLTTSQTPGTQSPSSGSTSISAALDLATVLKASQTLSSEIQLDKLLATLLHTVLENAGADKGALLMPRDHQWFVEAIATIDQPAQIEAIALSSSSEVPQSLINTVKRSQESVVVVDASVHLTLVTDAYIVQQRPKSLLCTPILNQGKLVAILYLENHITVGAFTRDRVKLLNFLCTQAAISLKNARLYQQAQTYAQQLEQSQLQIIQTEKMSALGNLVAGVAHEINNPVGFISGNLAEAKMGLTDLINYINLHQTQASITEIQEYAEEIDLKYLLSDLPRMIDSMQTGCDRIRDISTSLRTFSRADSDRPVAFNLHHGLDSTILILKHRLKADNSRPEIQIIKNYGQIPLIACYAGQLNQVFMNILANAIDALEESNQGQSFAEIQTNPNKITITTTVVDRHLQISIVDNGKGMGEEVKNKVFDHLFTTKEVGKGTGLGLAIAKQIVEEKHQGKISVNSKLGQGTEFMITLPIQ